MGIVSRWRLTQVLVSLVPRPRPKNLTLSQYFGWALGTRLGSDLSLISQDRQQKCFPHVQLNNTAVVLQTYTMAVLGVIMVQVRFGEYVNTHELYVVEENRPSLLGCAGLAVFKSRQCK